MIKTITTIILVVSITYGFPLPNVTTHLVKDILHVVTIPPINILPFTNSPIPKFTTQPRQLLPHAPNIANYTLPPNIANYTLPPNIANYTLPPNIANYTLPPNMDTWTAPQHTHTHPTLTSNGFGLRLGPVSSTGDDTSSNGYMVATLILIAVIVISVIIIIAVLYRYRQGSVEVRNTEAFDNPVYEMSP